MALILQSSLWLFSYFCGWVALFFAELFVESKRLKSIFFADGLPYSLRCSVWRWCSCWPGLMRQPLSFVRLFLAHISITGRYNIMLLMAKHSHIDDGQTNVHQKIGSRRLIGAVLLMHSHSTRPSAASRLNEKHICFECFINNFDPFLSLFFDIVRKSLTTPSMWKTSGPKYWLASSKFSSHRRRQHETPF